MTTTKNNEEIYDVNVGLERTRGNEKTLHIFYREGKRKLISRVLVRDGDTFINIDDVPEEHWKKFHICAKEYFERKK